MTTSQRASVVAAAAFVALHLPFLAPSLEDLDSFNFALGIRDFDVAQHQPHPPGYPLYMLLAKGVAGVAPSEVAALSLLAVLAGGLAVFGIVAVFRTLADRWPDADVRAHAAALLVVTTPLFWFTAARPLSDMPGLAAALGVQAALLRARSIRALAWAAGAGGLAVGLRSQLVWLTAPLLLLVVVRHQGRDRLKTAGVAAGSYLAGGLLWALPLVGLSGGPARYWRALVDQGAEDFTGVAMLWTSPTVRQLASALYHTFVAPWSAVPLAIVVISCAAIGCVVSCRSRDGRSAALTLLMAFGPYVAFHLVFQETATTRYALPVVVPIGYLAVVGAAAFSLSAPAKLAVGLAVVNAFIATQSLFWYSRMDAPAIRMLAEMREVDAAETEPSPVPVLAMHRRASLDLRRPIQWMGAGMPAVRQRLTSPPRHEWLEVVKYWNAGGRAPVWFVGDPLRRDLVLLQAGRPAQYRWPFASRPMLGGVRPNELDWYRIDPPAWYAGEGWALTPEAAGVAGEDGRGPGRAPISAWIRRTNEAVTVMVGGRSLTASGPAQVHVALDQQRIDDADVAPGFFLRYIDLPPGRLAGAGDYAELTISAETEGIAIEQFDAQPAGTVMVGYGDGWYEHEYDPRTGQTWRWASDRATLRIRSGRQPMIVRLRGEIEATSQSHVSIKVGDRTLVDAEIRRTFELAASIPADLIRDPETPLTIESSEWYVPAERNWRPSGDLRRLALKVFECRVLPDSAGAR